MAGPEIVIKVGTLITDEAFSGEKCVICNDAIYGVGFRVIVTTSTFREVLPKFSGSKVILCASCKDAIKW
jgi:hypothetical protein